MVGASNISNFDLRSNRLFIGILCCCFEYHDEMKEIMVLLLPLIILHIFILDFGTERYHTPWIALMLCICIAGL